MLAVIVATTGYIVTKAAMPIAAMLARFQGSSVGWFRVVVLTAAVVVGWVVTWFYMQRAFGQLGWVRALSQIVDAKKADQDALWLLDHRVKRIETRFNSAEFEQLLLEGMQEKRNSAGPRGRYP